jgi:hypothetical protein
MEIGSEFWYKKGEKKYVDSNNVYVLSGRTALEYIIRDMKAENPNIRSVYFPDYYCDSMILPFIRHKIDVMFYHIYTNKAGFHIAYNANYCDIVYLIDYFGYRIAEVTNIAEKVYGTGKKLIYDATHMLNGMERIKCDYVFCSYRKWFYSNAAVVKKNAPFLIPPPKKINASYVLLREQASKVKRDYIEGKLHSKQLFLDCFGRAEEILDRDYEDYGTEEFPTFNEEIILRRKRNAGIILQELRKATKSFLIIETIEADDCPLFVPILIPTGNRDKVRRRLIKQKIYCPVHWPLSEYHKGVKNQLYVEELSLVCDQRYDIEDMIRECEEVKKAVL